MAEHEISTLGIEITADSSKATRSVRKLERSLSSLQSRLQGFESGVGMQNLTTQLNGLSTALQGFKGIDGRTFSALARNLSKMGDANTEGVSKMTQSLAQMNSTLQGTNFSGSVEQISGLTKSLSRFGNNSMTQAIENLPRLAEAMRNFITTMAQAPNVSEGVVRLVEGVSNLTTSLTRMTRLGSNSGGALGSVFRGTSVVVNKTTHSFSRLREVTTKVKEKVKELTRAQKEQAQTHSTLASSVGRLIAQYWLLYRAMLGVGKAFGKGSEYVEKVNYFQSAMKQIALSNKDWQSAGYNDADTYVKAFTNKAQELTKKMSGLFVNEKGLLENTGTVSLGLNPTEVLNYQGLFGQMANSMGVATNEAMALSNVLVEIGADLASVKDMNFADVWQDMASGLTGMSRTLDKYGINIRNTALNEKLMSLGINATVKDLGQADKALLRTIVILDSSKYAWADLAETLDTPANQFRLIRANLDVLVKMLGSLFLPLLKRILPYVNALVIALQRLVITIAKVFGVDLSSMFKDTGGGNDALGDLMDESDELADNLDEADENAKKLKNHLLGIDELNIINENSDALDVGDDGGINLDLLDAFYDSLSEYQKAWDEAFKNLDNKAQNIADKIVEWAKKVFAPIKEAWGNTGEYVKNQFNRAKDAIGNLLKDIARDWAEVWKSDSVEKTFEYLFTSLGNIFRAIAGIANAFDEAWNKGEKGKKILQTLANIAEIIAKNLALVTDMIADFAEDLDFNPLLESTLKLLQAIEKHLDSFLQIINRLVGHLILPLLKKLVEDWLPKLIDALAYLVDKIKWSDLVKNFDRLFIAVEKIVEIGLDYIADHFKNLADVIADIVNSGWLSRIADNFENLASRLESANSATDVIKAFTSFIGDVAGDLSKTVSIIVDKINDLFDALNGKGKNGKSVLQTTFEGVGEAINKFISNLDLGSIGKMVSNVVKTFFNALVTTLKTVNWFKVGQKIGEFLANIDWLGIMKKVAHAIIEALKGAIEAIAGSFTKSPIATTLLTLFFGGKALSGLQNALKGFLGGDSFLSKILNSIGHIGGETNAFGALIDKAKGATKAKDGFSDANKILGKGASDSAKKIAEEVAEMGGVGASAKNAESMLGSVVTKIGGFALTIGGSATVLFEFFKMWKEGVTVVDGAVSVIGGALAGLDLVIAGVAGAPAILIGALVGALAVGVSAIHEHWDEISAWWNNSVVPWFSDKVNAVSEWWHNLWDKADGQTAIDKLKETFANLNILETLNEKIGQPVKAFFTETLPQALENFGNLISSKWDEFRDNSSNKWEEIKNAIGTKMVELGETMVEKWETIKENVANKLTEVKADAIEKWESVKVAISGKLEETKQKVGEVWNAIREDITEKTQNIKETVVAKWEELKKGVSEKVNALRDNIATTFEDIRKNAQEKWEEMRSNITEKAEQIRSAVANKWESIKSDTLDKVEAIRNVASQKWEEVRSTIENKAEEIRQTTARKWDDVKETLREKTEAIKDTMAKKWEEIRANTEDKIEQIRTSAVEKWESVRNGISDKLETIKSDVTGKWETIKNNTQNKIDAIAKYTSSKWDEIKSNAKSKWSAIASDMQGHAEGVSNKIAEGFKSLPSKLSTAFDGLSSSLSGVFKPVGEILDGLIEKIKKFFNNGTQGSLSQGIQNLFPSFGTFATGGFPEDGWFRASHGEMIGKFDNGKSVVANNQQITDGIATATYNAMMKAYNSTGSREEALLEELISAVREGKKVVIDGREIVSTYDSRKARNGYAF